MEIIATESKGLANTVEVVTISFFSNIIPYVSIFVFSLYFLYYVIRLIIRRKYKAENNCKEIRWSSTRPLFVLAVLICWKAYAELDIRVCWIFFFSTFMILVLEIIEKVTEKSNQKNNIVNFALNIIFHLICLAYLLKVIF